MTAPAGGEGFVEGLRPRATGDGLSGPFDESLAENLAAAVAPVDPALVAAAFDDGSDAHALLDGGGVGEALATLTEGGEQPRGERAPRAREIRKQRIVGKGVGQAPATLRPLVLRAISRLTRKETGKPKARSRGAS